jgi:hypothetical protein
MTVCPQRALSRRASRVVWALVAVLGYLLVANSLAQAAGPAWHLSVRSDPTNLVPGSSSTESQQPGHPLNSYPQYTVMVTNIGGAASSGPTVITDTLPPGVTPTAGLEPTGLTKAKSESFPCGVSGQTVTCTYENPVPSGLWLKVGIPVDVAATSPRTVTNVARVEGGGAVTQVMSLPTAITASAPPFEFLPGQSGLSAMISEADGSAATGAGTHPYQLTIAGALPSLTRPFVSTENVGGIFAAHAARDITVELPSGIVVNPNATSVRCREEQLQSLVQGNKDQGCPDASQIGTVNAITAFEFGPIPLEDPIYNMVPPPGVPAEIGFEALAGILVHMQGGLNTEGNYTLTASAEDLLARPQQPILGFEAQLWGDPSDTAHERSRLFCLEEAKDASCPVFPVTTALLTMPSSCSGPLTFGAAAVSWDSPTVVSRNALSTDPVTGAPVGVDECGRLPFNPAIAYQPETSAADSPTGLDVNLKLPQEEGIKNRASATLKKVTAVLPPGLELNASAADGLAGCSEGQIGLVSSNPIRFNSAAPQCPDASKVGSVLIKTPLLDEEVPGSLYLAQQEANPFGSLLAGYLYAEAQGATVKLAGRFDLNQQTGQITAVFDENPQLPFNELKLHFKGGSRATLTTPQTCGDATVNTIFEPWSAPQAPNVTVPSTFPINSGANGGGCPASQGDQSNNPQFEAGTVEPLAGRYSPFVLKLSRENGTQRFQSVDTTLPPGVSAKLAGVTECSDAQIAAAAARSNPGQGALEKASPSCPASSEIGTVTVGVGSGSPLYVNGRAYLAGPYKGAPLSVAIITPAVAGPFDLGVVVVRVALNINELTAQVHAVSDAVPSIIQGVPLDVRSIALKLGRNNFTLNPTSCEPMNITGTAISTLGNAAPLASRFQVGACEGLGFKPELSLRLKGGTTRAKHPALTAIVTYPKGSYANIARARVALPHSEFLDQGNIGTVCTRPQLASRTCPKKSIYGHAKAWTPILDKPLEGPVYLGAGWGHKLPDLVAELNGQVRIIVHGKVDTGPKEGIRNTFEAVPDAPVSRFVLKLRGGRKQGLLVNSENICKKPQHVEARFTAQNGKVFSAEPTIKNDCGKQHKKGKPAKKSRAQ